MALRRSEDYATLGRNHAQNDSIPGGLACTHPYKRGSASWQAKAYWLAYDDEMARLTAKKERESPSGMRGGPDIQNWPKLVKDPVLTKRYVGDTTHWPKAAAEHAALLVADWNQEEREARRWRLGKAIQRMWKRHGVPRLLIG